MLILMAAALVVVAVLGAGLLRGMGAVGTRSTTSGQPAGTVLMSLGQTPRMLGPGITMNYTLTISPGAENLGAAELTATSPSGVTVNVNPSSVTLAGNSIAVDVSVRESGPTVSGVYAIGFKVAWSTGSSNETFAFTVVQHMVLLVGAFTHPGEFDPQSINIRPGDSVTWLSIDPGGDEYGQQRQVRIAEENVTSPTLILYSSWSYTFDRVGTYTIEDSLNAQYVPNGSIIVG